MPGISAALPWWSTCRRVEDFRIADLLLPSGVIIACDPLAHLRRARQLQRSVEPGAYPVHVGLTERWVAYARIVFSSGAIATWQPALHVGDADPETLRRTPPYPVSAGAGAFIDLLGALALIEREDQEEPRRPEQESWLLGKLHAAGYADGKYAVLPIGDANLVAFRSGFGHGHYASFWGVDAAGAPVCLVTDFDVLTADDGDDLDEDEVATSEIAAEAVSPFVAKATALVGHLEERRLIELGTDASRSQLADDLASFLAAFQVTRLAGDQLSSWLMDHELVAEVFADDRQLDAALRVTGD